MKKSTPVSLYFFVVCVSLLNACATGSFNSSTGPGFIYSEHTEGVIATSISAGKKRGQACTQNILGLFTSGDASFGAAMKNGAISVVSTADRHYESIMGVYGKMCLMVTGN